MKSPGELLRHAREEKGLSLSEAAAMTRISRTMLKHLEQDRFEEFNAEVFVRGHLRNYAREIGADPEAIVQAYERFNGTSAGKPKRVAPERARPTKQIKKPARTPRGGSAPEQPRRSKVSRPTPKTNWVQKIGPTHMVAVVLVLVGLLLFVSLLSGNRATAQDPAKFPTKSQDAWELERDVEETRWLLERPAEESSDRQ